MRIKPDQRKDSIEKISGLWQIRLKAPAVDGKANEYLIAYLADLLRLPKSAVAIRRGHTSRLKYLDISEEAQIVEEKLLIAANKGL